ncbi:hypothetical protein B0H10DRAFT_2230588 [Mycena sp. CBHHK59/15]|nr:hypothetical protein B0H10DRAFT_2230588 [Mycena sp. CBHHK59/15]
MPSTPSEPSGPTKRRAGDEEGVGGLPRVTKVHVVPHRESEPTRKYIKHLETELSAARERAANVESRFRVWRGHASGLDTKLKKITRDLEEQASRQAENIRLVDEIARAHKQFGDQAETPASEQKHHADLRDRELQLDELDRMYSDVCDKLDAAEGVIAHINREHKMKEKSWNAEQKCLKHQLDVKDEEWKKRFADQNTLVENQTRVIQQVNAQLSSELQSAREQITEMKNMQAPSTTNNYQRTDPDVPMPRVSTHPEVPQHPESTPPVDKEGVQLSSGANSGLNPNTGIVPPLLGSSQSRARQQDGRPPSSANFASGRSAPAPPPSPGQSRPSDSSTHQQGGQPPSSANFASGRSAPAPPPSPGQSRPSDSSTHQQGGQPPPGGNTNSLHSTPQAHSRQRHSRPRNSTAAANALRKFYKDKKFDKVKNTVCLRTQELLGIEYDREVHSKVHGRLEASNEMVENFIHNRGAGPTLNPFRVFWPELNHEWNLKLQDLFVADILAKNSGMEHLTAELVQFYFAQRLTTLDSNRKKAIKQEADPDFLENSLQVARRGARRDAVHEYRTRVTMKIKRDRNLEPYADVLLRMVSSLGALGMSSEESTNDAHKSCNVVRKDWRHTHLVGLLKLLDRLGHSIEVTKYGSRKSGPARHARNRETVETSPVSTREAMKQLPINFYNPVWLAGLTETEVGLLDAAPAVELPVSLLSWPQHSKRQLWTDPDDQDEYWPNIDI